jgi:hypothetical protein
MKATQDNAVWVSNTYEQEAVENNWSLMGVSYRTPKNTSTIVSSTTDSVKVLNTNLNNGDSLSLYNPTDGYVDYSASITSQETANNTTDLGALSPQLIPSTTTKYLTSDFFNGYLMDWNKDGTRFWTYTGGGGFSEYSPPRPWDPFGVSKEGPTLLNSYSFSFLWPNDGSTDAPNLIRTRLSFSNDGLYMFITNWDSANNKRKYIIRYTLSAPYDLSTATSPYYVQMLSTGSVWYSLFLSTFTSTLAVNYWNGGGFNNIKFSDDGLKGWLVRKDQVTEPNATGSIGQYGSLVSFVLSKPFDLNTVVSFQFSNANATTHWSGSAFSDDGKVAYIFHTVVNGTGYIYRRHFTVPFSASSFSSTYSASLFYFSSANYYANSAGYPASVTISPDGSLKTMTSLTWFYINTTAEPTPLWNRTILDTTSASLTEAATKVFTSSPNVSAISYQQITRSEAFKENKALAIGKDSTNTSLTVYPDLNSQGSTALNNSTLSIDGTPFPVTSTTFTDNLLNVLGSNESAASKTSKGTTLEATATYLGATQLQNPATYTPVNTNEWNFPQGMAFDKTGTRFWKQGYADSYGGNSGISRPIVEFVLTTPWDLATASFVKAHNAFGTLKGASPDPSTNYDAQCFQFNNDGSKMYVLHSLSSGGVGYLYEGNLRTPYDISSWSYNWHVSLSTLLVGYPNPYAYSFDIAEDGKAVIFNLSPAASGNLTSPSYNISILCQMTNPWSLQSITYKRLHSTTQDYRSAIVGDEENGYITYNCSYPVNNNYDTLFLGTASGNLISSNVTGGELNFATYAENYSPLGSVIAGKTLVADNGTKLFIHIPLIHTVMSFTGSFGNFNDRHVIDITSLGLTGQPKDVRFAINSTYTALPSGSVSTNNDLYTEYTVPDEPIDAETLRFKIEGDTGTEVSRFNVNLYTS